jgi:hypothetical protein
MLLPGQAGRAHGRACGQRLTSVCTELVQRFQGLHDVGLLLTHGGKGIDKGFDTPSLLRG